MRRIFPYKQGADMSITLAPEKSGAGEKLWEDVDATVEWHEAAEDERPSAPKPTSELFHGVKLATMVEIRPSFSSFRATTGAREENSHFLVSLGRDNPIDLGSTGHGDQLYKEDATNAMVEKYLDIESARTVSGCNSETLPRRVSQETCKIETCVDAGKKSLNNAARKSISYDGRSSSGGESKTSHSSPKMRRKLRLPRSKNGCWTCRCRRKKCDETLPKCRTCKDLGIDCSGYGTNRPVFMTDREAGIRYRSHISKVIHSHKRAQKTKKAKNTTC
ncbi:hypothetical protein TRVA0_004S01574 [Trichomonascus vanleenenianus]|uniref:Uga3p n=1 Tax=Trichomonascus vanleenenianus TaxID=2268995 RepID=UPI003EC955C7